MKTLTRKELSLEIINKCSNVKKRIWISSPFVGGERKVLGILGSKFALTEGIDLKLLVDVSDIQNCSYQTLNSLCDLGFEIRTLTGLHAKIYVTDNDCIVTSANLTERAFTKKYEIGISLANSESKEAISIFSDFFKRAHKIKRFTESEIKKQKRITGKRFKGAERGGDADPFMSIQGLIPPQVTLPLLERKRTLRNFTDQSKVWKISLGRRWSEGFVYESCIRTNTIAIGWLDDRDISNWSYERILETLNREDSSDINRTQSTNSIYNFTTQMENGDLVVVFEGRNIVRAIGIVTGNYYWDNTLVDRYAHRRNVLWLTHGGSINIYSLNGDKQLSESTLYELHRVNHDRIVNLIVAL